jgi:hypothetical protein
MFGVESNFHVLREYHTLDFSKLARSDIPSDGNRIPMPEPDWDGTVLNADSLLENMNCDVITKDVLKIAGASEVEARLGVVTFKFSDDNMAALRAIAKKIKPTSQK